LGVEFHYQSYLPDIAAAAATYCKVIFGFQRLNWSETALTPVCSVIAADGTAGFLASFRFPSHPVNVQILDEATRGVGAD